MTQEAKKPDLVITREFNAPKELVYKMWTEAEHLAHWWGPKGFEMEIAKFDFRPGGVFHYVMRMNDVEMWGKFLYREITAPDRIVFINCFSDKEGNIARSPFMPVWPLEILNTLTLEEENGKTKLTLSGGPINATDEELQAFKDMVPNMQQGFGGTFEQLDAYLATM